jgi:hypothetical protein
VWRGRTTSKSRLFKVAKSDYAQVLGDGHNAGLNEAEAQAGVGLDQLGAAAKGGEAQVDDLKLANGDEAEEARFNRRRSHSRGLVFYRVMQLAVCHKPVRYHELILNPEPNKNPPTGRRAGCGHPPSLERPLAGRPWRAAWPAAVRLSGYPYVGK